jgi:hypothetical protein
MRIEGDTLSELLPVAPLPLSTSFPSSPWWKGFSSSMVYGTVEVTYSVLCFTNYSPMVDLLLLTWFMRCKVIFVLDVWIDVYVTLPMCACSDQTSTLGLVRGLCALGGVILYYDWGSDRNSWGAMVFTFSMITSLLTKEYLCLHRPVIERAVLLERWCLRTLLSL